MIESNTQGDCPRIDVSAYVHPTAVVIGNVTIGKNVFVGPCAVVRADEKGTSIMIGDNCNIQDRVIIHSLEANSVLIEGNTSLSHGCVVHGPCRIGKGCFVGFGSVVFNCEIHQAVIIKHLVIAEGVCIPAGKMVESGNVIRDEKDVRELKLADEKMKDFAEKVVSSNLDLVEGYRKKQKGGNG